MEYMFAFAAALVLRKIMLILEMIYFSGPDTFDYNLVSSFVWSRSFWNKSGQQVENYV